MWKVLHVVRSGSVEAVAGNTDHVVLWGCEGLIF